MSPKLANHKAGSYASPTQDDTCIDIQKLRLEFIAKA